MESEIPAFNVLESIPDSGPVSRTDLDWRSYPELKTELSPEQEDAFHLLPHRKRFLIADQTGLGKTYSAISSFVALKNQNLNRHLLVACTKKGTVTWKSEITKHTDLVSFVYSTDRKSMDVDLTNMREIQEDISIIQHSSFLKFKNMLRTIYDNRDIVLLVDEAHHLRNPEQPASNRYRHYGYTRPAYSRLASKPRSTSGHLLPSPQLQI